MRLAPVKPPITIWFEVILKNSVVIFKRNSGTYRNYFIFYINVLLRRWAQGKKLMVPQWLVCRHTPKMHIPRNRILNHFLNLKAADRAWTTTACWAIFASTPYLRASGKTTTRQHTRLHSTRGHTRWHTRHAWCVTVAFAADIPYTKRQSCTSNNIDNFHGRGDLITVK